MSVNSNDNKALLWNLLSKHPNQKKDSKKFQAVLEYRVNEIHRNRFKFGNDLMAMNKEIIKQFASEIPAQPPKTSQPKPLSKAKVFEQRLKSQQDNFNQLINKQKPKEIDFSDKTEDAPIDARMVDDTLQQRELELKNIMAQYDSTGKNANEWLKGEETSTAKHLKIDKKTNIKIESDVVNVPTNQRRVRFEVEEKPTKPTKPISFLDKLKKIDVKDEIINHLKRIEEKQDLILGLLQSKAETT